LLQEGTIVAGYRIDGVLGDGGMGVVYRATQLSLEREVALKVLSSDLGDDSGFRIRFQREGQLQAALDHDHIVPVYEAGQSEQGLFLAMRLIDGPTLKDLILARELDPRRSVRLLSQVAHALDAAHAAGLIHRDIKPQNILIGPGDHAYLADFGLIKAPAEAARLTGTGQFIGTIDYVAPEQIQGEPASAASDIYALAGVLYECLTGEVPFPKPNEAATLHAHVIAPPPKVTDLRPELPPAIDDVIARGMAKDPMARPPSATELMLVASRALASAPSIVGPPSGLASAGVSSGGAPGAQATRVRTRPAVSDSGSAPALERAGDGAGAAPATAPREPAASVAAPPEPAAPVAAPPEAPAPAEPADPPRPATAP
jgi:serine/threonine-protein kinase